MEDTRPRLSQLPFHPQNVVTFYEKQVPKSIVVAPSLIIAPGQKADIQTHETVYIQVDGTLVADEGAKAFCVFVVMARDHQSNEQEFRLALAPSVTDGWQPIMPWIDKTTYVSHGHAPTHSIFLKQTGQYAGHNKRVKDVDAFLASEDAENILGKDALARVKLLKEKFEAGLLSKPVMEQKNELMESSLFQSPHQRPQTTVLGA